MKLGVLGVIYWCDGDWKTLLGEILFRRFRRYDMGGGDIEMSNTVCFCVLKVFLKKI